MNYEILEEYYKDHHIQLIKRYSRATGSDHAGEDIVHDAFERAMRYYKAFRQEDDISRWMSLILRNAYRDYLKAERGQFEEELDEYQHVGSECDGLIRKIWKEVEVLIDEANPAHQEVLRFYFLQGYGVTDISKFTPFTVNTVAQIVLRFRNKVRKLYGIK